MPLCAAAVKLDQYSENCANSFYLYVQHLDTYELVMNKDEIQLSLGNRGATSRIIKQRHGEVPFHIPTTFQLDSEHTFRH